MPGQLFGGHSDGGVVRAVVNALGVSAHVLFAQVAVGGDARGRVRLAIAAAALGHVDAAVGAVVSAETAADAMVLDDDGERVHVGAARVSRAPVNGVDRAADQAHRVLARPAGAGHQVLPEAVAFEKQARYAAVRGGTGLDAFLAARAAVEV